MKLLPTLCVATALLAGIALPTISGSAATIQAKSVSFTRVDAIQQGPDKLGRFLEEHPGKLAVVLVSTPGCGFCDLVRQRQLAPLLRDAAFKNVSVFEVTMRDAAQFNPAIERFSAFDGTTVSNIASPADLSRLLGLRLAPTVLFVGQSRELSERLIGYGNADFYFAYLAERIEQAEQKLTRRD